MVDLVFMVSVGVTAKGVFGVTGTLILRHRTVYFDYILFGLHNLYLLAPIRLLQHSHLLDHLDDPDKVEICVQLLGAFIVKFSDFVFETATFS